MSEPAPAFETIIARLQEVVGELERGDLPLERSLALFEEGVRLAREGGSRLDAAETRVEELLSVNEAGVRTRPLETKSPIDPSGAKSAQQREPR
jgi:exodeoxyribonuclease VII small subunit